MDSPFFTPRACFAAACVAFTFVAVSQLLRGQSHNQPTPTAPETANGSATSKSRPLPQRRRAADSLYIGTKDNDTDQPRTHARREQIAIVLSLSVKVAQLLRSCQQDQNLSAIVVDLLNEISRITTGLCCLQQELYTNPSTCNDATGLSACFDVAFGALQAIFLSTEAMLCNGKATINSLKNVMQQLRDQRPSMDFLLNHTNTSQLPPTPPSDIESSMELSANESRLELPGSLGAPTGITPGMDQKSWIEPPPEYSPPGSTNGLAEVYEHPEKPAPAPEEENVLPSDPRSVDESDALYEAVNENHSDAVADLLANGSDPACTFGDLQRSALHQAAHLNHVACLTVLLRHGASMNAEDAKGDTPLHLAAWSGHVEALSAFLAHGADVDWLSGRDGYSALWCAISAHHIDAARLLLKHGARVSQRSMSGGGLMPLHQAAVTGQGAMCELLLERGALVDCRDEDQNTPLHYAAASGSVPAVKALLRGGADIEAKQIHGLTAVHWAAHKGHVEVLTVVLDYGAALDPIAEEGATPLHLAANRGHTSVARLLIERGARKKPGPANWDGIVGTPAQMAKAKGFTRLAKELKG